MLTKNLSRNWYDKNPLVISQFYGANGLAPHADVQRWAYTVPAARRAMLEFGLAQYIKETVSGAAAWAQSYIRYTPSGGSNSVILSAASTSVGVGAGQTIAVGFNSVLLAGDAISGRSQDGMTGGTATIQIAAKATEFDA